MAILTLIRVPVPSSLLAHALRLHGGGGGTHGRRCEGHLTVPWRRRKPWAPGAHCGEVATWAGTCCHLRHEEAPIWAGHLIVSVPGMTHDGLFAVGCATSALQMHYTPLA